MCLTFDLDRYGVLNVADLIGGGAHIFTSIFKCGLWDLNQLIEVLYLHLWRCCEVLTVLGPGDMRSWP